MTSVGTAPIALCSYAYSSTRSNICHTLRTVRGRRFANRAARNCSQSVTVKWDSLNAQVRRYLENVGDSIDIAPIISRYTGSVREFYGWFWLKVEEKMKPDRVEYDAHVAELMVYGEEVFLAPDWIRQSGGEPPPGWKGARWRRRSLAEIRQRRWALGHRSFRGVVVDGQGVAEVGDHPWTPIRLRVN